MHSVIANAAWQQINGKHKTEPLTSKDVVKPGEGRRIRPTTQTETSPREVPAANAATLLVDPGAAWMLAFTKPHSMQRPRQQRPKADEERSTGRREHCAADADSCAPSR
jgi:hypothetical protein